MKKNNIDLTKYEGLEFLSEELAIAKRNVVKSDLINYPKYHIAPKIGLLNDPNGLCYYNGYYHIFYQIHPNATIHGLKHWNHIKTKDFVEFEDLGIILSPSNDDDNFGVYSGGAIKPKNSENLFLFYTGNRRDCNDDYIRKPTQCLAIMNIDDEIIFKDKIIDTNFQYTEHFRDPYPISMDDKNYLLIGAQKLSKTGSLVLYEMDSEFKNTLNISDIQFSDDLCIKEAYMLECPSYFNIYDSGLEEMREVLVFSPQGIKPKDKYNFNNIFDVVYTVSHFGDLFDGKWESNNICTLDYGFDFYAPQTFNDEFGRVILISWLGQAETLYPGDDVNEWSQMLSIPRQINLVNNKVIQTPIKELEMLRIGECNQICANDGILYNKKYKVESKSFELIAEVDKDFQIIIGNVNHSVKIYTYDGDFIFDRSNMQYAVNEAYGTKRYIKLSEILKWNVCESIKLQVFVDNSSIEVFINNGEFVMSSRYFIDELDYIEFKSVISAGVYYIKNIEI